MMFRTLILVASLIATPAMAGSFFQWTDDQGAISFTDDIDRIPEKYFDRAVERTSEELKASVENRWSEVKVAPLVRLRTSDTVERANPVEGRTFGTSRIRGTRSLNVDLEAGGGKSVVIKERRDVDGGNREFYVLYDENGEESAVSQTPIHIYKEK